MVGRDNAGVGQRDGHPLSTLRKHRLGRGDDRKERWPIHSPNSLLAHQVWNTVYRAAGTGGGRD